MSGPTPGSDPNHPQGGAPQGYGGAPSDPAQGYTPAPQYSGAPAGYGGPTGQRPPQVLVAAILGFVVGFFALIGSFGLFALATIFGLFALFGVLYLALAAVNIWGGILAIQGKGSTVLKIAGAVTAGLALLGLILALTQTGFDFWSLLLVAAGVAIFVLLNQPASQQWFASRGAR